jgi:hypothetical protein
MAPPSQASLGLHATAREHAKGELLPHVAQTPHTNVAMTDTYDVSDCVRALDSNCTFLGHQGTTSNSDRSPPNDGRYAVAADRRSEHNSTSLPSSFRLKKSVSFGSDLAHAGDADPSNHPCAPQTTASSSAGVCTTAHADAPPARCEATAAPSRLSALRRRNSEPAIPPTLPPHLCLDVSRRRQQLAGAMKRAASHPARLEASAIAAAERWEARTAPSPQADAQLLSRR